MNLCEWNPLYNRPRFHDNEVGNCHEPVAWGVGFQRTQWKLCNECVKLPVFNQFKFKEKVEPKPQCVEDNFQL